MPNERPPVIVPPKISRVEIYWRTVTYKTVAIYLLLALAIVISIVYLLNPQLYTFVLDNISKAVGNGTSAAQPSVQNQAHFVNLDGRVQVKKVNSVQWTSADYRTGLDKGDLIQTGSDAAARITFVDGTTYTVQADTLVTVEENSVGRNSETRVGMHISSGAVDLTTGQWESPQSKAEVSFSNAVASVKQNSRAAVRSDPATKQSEITISQGGAEVERQDGSQKIDIGRYERVTIPPNGSFTKTDVLAPPDLLVPIESQPMIVPDPKHAAIRFEWKREPEAVSYELRVSTTSMFSRIVADRTLPGTTAEITGLDSGDYFWDVMAIDAQKHVSAPSDTHKFILVAQDKAQDMLLEVDRTELHGSVVEVIGRTEPGAVLIINGETVANIQPDGKFRFFTQPLARGSQTIVITGQNRRGDTNTKRVDIVVP